MNTQFLRQRTTTRSLNAFPWCLSLVGVMLCLCAGIALLLFPVSNETKASRRVPAGQFKADTRTFVAALWFLVRPEPGMEGYSTPNCPPPCVFALQQKDQPCTALNSQSNQSEVCIEPLTNRPARS